MINYFHHIYRVAISAKVGYGQQGRKPYENRLLDPTNFPSLIAFSQESIIKINADSVE